MVSDDDSFHIIKMVELKNKRGEAEEKILDLSSNRLCVLTLGLQNKCE